MLITAGMGLLKVSLGALWTMDGKMGLIQEMALLTPYVSSILYRPCYLHNEI